MSRDLHSLVDAIIEEANDLNKDRKTPITPMELFYRLGCIPSGFGSIHEITSLSIVEQFMVFDMLNYQLYSDHTLVTTTELAGEHCLLDKMNTINENGGE